MSLLSSHVTALRPCLPLQFIPQTHHLPGRLVMGGVIVFYATKLAELQAMRVVYRFRAVKLLYPHSHTHIFHLKQLHKEQITQTFSQTKFQNHSGKEQRKNAI